MIALALAAPSAHGDGANSMLGPVLGYSWPHGRPGHHSQLFYGFEAGLGWGPERFDVGITNRDGEAFGYVELDPWYVIGVSAGVGIGAETGVHGVLGIWEGMPLTDVCNGGTVYPNGKLMVATLSIGLRWSGATEIYVTPKVGVMDPICLAFD